MSPPPSSLELILPQVKERLPFLEIPAWLDTIQETWTENRNPALKIIREIIESERSFADQLSTLHKLRTVSRGLGMPNLSSILNANKDLLETLEEAPDTIYTVASAFLRLV